MLQEEHRLEIIATGVLSLLVIGAGLIVSRRRKAGRVGAAALG
ncbi:GABA permease [Pseudomonas savastanoi pv. fraxini]|nr:GABA permease [Pseudomonas savastanoi pv. fraxini]